MQVIRRLAFPAVGIAGTTVFLVVAFTSNLPMYGDSVEDWGPWAAAHQSEARDGIALLFLAYLLYMIFGVYVATLVKKADTWTPVLAQIATVAVGVKFSIEIIQIAVLNIPAQAGVQGFGSSMAQLGTELSIFGLVPFALFLLAIGTAALISRAMPAWLAWLTLAVGSVHAFAMVLGLTGPPPLGPALMAFGFVWFLSIPGWPLVTGVALFIGALITTRPAATLRAQPIEGGQPA